MSMPTIDASCDCAKCVANSQGFYVVMGACSNCGTRFRVRNRQGDRPPLSVECPGCKVMIFGWRNNEPVVFRGSSDVNH
jgi:hypothetical protein